MCELNLFLQENEEITVGQAHENTRKLYRNISTGMAAFINQKREMFVNT